LTIWEQCRGAKATASRRIPAFVAPGSVSCRSRHFDGAVLSGRKRAKPHCACAGRHGIARLLERRQAAIHQVAHGEIEYTIGVATSTTKPARPASVSRMWGPVRMPWYAFPVL